VVDPLGAQRVEGAGDRGGRALLAGVGHADEAFGAGAGEHVGELARRVPAPLVQHGTCGIPLDLVRKLVAAGIAKVNYGEPFRAGFIAYFQEYAQTMDHGGHPWKIMQACKERLKEDMKAIIRALGSDGKA